MIDIGLIDKIDSCRRAIAKASEDMKRLSAPSSYPKECVVECYRRMFPDWKKPENTKVLIFVYLYLFDPMSLTGRKMRSNIHNDLTKVLELNTPQIISIRARHLMFSYRTFPAFRSSADALYDKVLSSSQDVNVI